MRIYINTPYIEDDEAKYIKRINALADRIRKRGDVPVMPSSEGACFGENIGINVSSIIEVCDAILLDIGWKRNPACIVVYQTAIAFGKSKIFHTKEEYNNIRDKYVI